MASAVAHVVCTWLVAFRPERALVAVLRRRAFGRCRRLSLRLCGPTCLCHALRWLACALPLPSHGRFVAGGCFLSSRRQGHNCFGAILHPITMADFLVAGVFLARPLCCVGFAARAHVSIQISPTRCDCSCTFPPRLVITSKFFSALLAEALDGYVSSFPSTYAAKDSSCSWLA